jgi:hypothetical protein
LESRYGLILIVLDGDVDSMNMPVARRREEATWQSYILAMQAKSCE